MFMNHKIPKDSGTSISPSTGVSQARLKGAARIIPVECGAFVRGESHVRAHKQNVRLDGVFEVGQCLKS